MPSTTLAHSIDPDGIAVFELTSRTNPVTLAALANSLQAVAKDDKVNAILLHAQGPAWLAAESAQDWLELCSRQSASQIAAALQQRSDHVRSIERLGKPVAIVLDGDCLDLCLEVALACQQRIAVASDTMRLGLPLIPRGIPPSAGATQRLPRIAGIAAALPWLLSGALSNAQAARDIGVLHHSLPMDQTLAQARAWLLDNAEAAAPWDIKGFRIPGGAGAMAAHAGRSFSDPIASLRKATNDTQPAPLAVLTAVYEGTQLPMDAALRVEVQCAAQALAEAASTNQIRTLWLDADEARQLVRRPDTGEQAAVRKLGVLGAGLMGAGIAQVAAAAGIDTVLIDTSAERAQAARGKVAAALTRTHGEKAETIANRIHASDDLALLKGCDFIVEAVFEDRNVKADLMQRAAMAMGDCPAHFVWASNTSTLPISGLAAAWAEPGQVIGMHFFSPVPRMPLLEIIMGEHTSQETLARTMDLAARMGKTPILVNDSPGFYTSRIFCAYIDEGMAMLAEGVNPALIENAARQAGFATSPLAVTDEVSLDLQALVIEQAEKDDLPEKFLRRSAKPVVDIMNRLKRLGRKSAGGFYDYPDNAPKHLWPGLEQEFPRLAQQPSVETVRMRLLNMQAMESARCLEESVITNAADANIGSILGLGYPAWTGGTLSYIDTIGCDRFVEQCDTLADQYGERFRPSQWLRDCARKGLTFRS